MTTEEFNLSEIKEMTEIGNLFSYRKFSWKNKYGDFNSLLIRNVNNEVEVSIEQTKHNKKRCKYLNFVLPSDAFEEFIKAVKNPYKSEDLEK